MERYVAIDNVCAWPNLTRLPDGTLVAVIFDQPTHGGWEGDVVAWASEDDGRTWHFRGVAAPHEPGTNRMNVAAGLAHDGSLLVLASGWSRRGPVGEASSPHTGEVLDPWICRSTDGGRTWARVGTLRGPADGPPPGTVEHLIPFGDIVPLPGGDLGVCLYGLVPGGDNRALFYASGDVGLTWLPRGVIRAGNANETAPLVLPGGRLLAAARTLGDQHLDLLASDDDGATWAECGALTLGAQHPGHLLRLDDGRVLLTYGIRNRGLYGVGARLSEDDGLTWGAPRVLAALEGSTDGGYPSTVQVEGGTLVTAYYSNGIPWHQRYHMGVVRWRPDA